MVQDALAGLRQPHSLGAFHRATSARQLVTTSFRVTSGRRSVKQSVELTVEARQLARRDLAQLRSASGSRPSSQRPSCVTPRAQ